jgi:DNA end-binding protein Ku
MSRSGTAVAERPAARKRPRPTPSKPRPHSRRGSERGRPAPSGGPRPVWSGSISFGLVNIPVRLFTAVREQRVAFHLLHDQDKARLRRKVVSSTTGKEIHPEHIVRGYPVGPGRYVIVSQEELEACSPEKTKAIEITDFVKLSEIDPVYYERPYYVLPQKGAARSYRLLLEAMRRAGRVGVARVVIHEKEYLAALRPLGELVCLSTMHLSEEVLPPSEVEETIDAAPAEREVKQAERLIQSMLEDFDPGRYRDEYRDCVRKMVEQKAASEKEIVRPAPEKSEKKPHEARATDLMAALEQSLARAKGQAKRRKSA